jgi:hypothetical protein
MRRHCGSIALAFTAALSGGALLACFSSSGGNDNTAQDSGSDDSATPDGGQPAIDATTDTDGAGHMDAGSGGGDSGDAGPGEAGMPGTIALPGTVDETVKPGVNRTTNKFYVAWNDNTAPATHGVAVIDALTGTVSANITVGCRGGLAVDETNNRIYVPTVIYPDGSAIGAPAIAVVDGSTNQVTSTIYQTQGQTFDAGSSAMNWGITFLAVDPAANSLYAYLGDGFGNGYVFKFNTSNMMLTGSIATPGTEPGSGGGLVVDAVDQRLWAVGGTRQSLGPGATVTTIDTSTFTVLNTGTKQSNNATDVALDPTAAQALAMLPVIPVVDGGAVDQPGSVQAASATGSTSTPFTLPSGLAGTFARVIGQRTLVYANNASGTYYLLGYGTPDAGAWSLHGQSAAVTPQPPQPSFDPASALNVYGFEAVTDSTKAYVIAVMDYEGNLSGPIVYSSQSVQYWQIALP